MTVDRRGCKGFCEDKVKIPFGIAFHTVLPHTSRVKFWTHALAIAVVATTAVSCQRKVEVTADDEWNSLEAKRIDLAGREQVLRYRADRLDESEATYRGQMDALEQVRMRVTVAKDQRAGLEQEIDLVSKKFLADRTKRRMQVRAAIAGTRFAEFITTGGRTYHEVTVIEVVDSGVRIRHQDGTARMGCDDLTAAQRETFGLDLDLAQNAVAREDHADRTYHEAMARELEATAAQQPAPDSRPAPRPSTYVPARPSPFRQTSLSDPPRRAATVRGGPRYWGNSYDYNPYAGSSR